LYKRHRFKSSDSQQGQAYDNCKKQLEVLQLFSIL
jgi:hypothetical protein